MQDLKQLPEVENISSVLPQDVPVFVDVARACYELHAHAKDFPKRQVVHVIGSKSNPDAYSLLVFGYRDMLTMQEFTKIRKLRNVTRTHIDPYYIEEQSPKWPGDNARILPPVPVLMVEIGAENTFLALMTDKTRQQRPSSDDDITVKPDDLDRLYPNPQERNPVPLDKFGDMKNPMNLEDFRIMNDIACVLSHIHQRRTRPQLVERMLYYYDTVNRVYVIMAEGLHGVITINDMAQIFAVHPTYVSCIGYNFHINTRKDDSSFAPGGIVIHLKDSTQPTKQSVLAVETPAAAAVEIPQIPPQPAPAAPEIIVVPPPPPAIETKKRRAAADDGDDDVLQPRWKKSSGVIRRFIDLFSY